MLLAIIIAIVVYSSMAFLSYSNTLKESIWFVPAGLLLAIIANLTWFITSKNITETKEQFLLVLIWDVIIVLAYILTPFIFFNFRPSAITYVGLTFLIVGLLITKISH